MTTIRLFVSSDYAITRDGIRALLERRAKDIRVVGEGTVPDAAEKVHTAAADSRKWEQNPLPSTSFLPIEGSGSVCHEASTVMVRAAVEDA